MAGGFDLPDASHLLSSRQTCIDRCSVPEVARYQRQMKQKQQQKANRPVAQATSLDGVWTHVRWDEQHIGARVQDGRLANLNGRCGRRIVSDVQGSNLDRMKA